MDYKKGQLIKMDIQRHGPVGQYRKNMAEYHGRYGIILKHRDSRVWKIIIGNKIIPVLDIHFKVCDDD